MVDRPNSSYDLKKTIRESQEVQRGSDHTNNFSSREEHREKK